MLATLIVASSLTGLQDPPSHVATTPVERLSEAWWKDRHAQRLQVTKAGNVELAFLGDSITHSWEGSGKPVWDHYYGHRKAANFGYSGDRTEHVLWRLGQGELVPLQPKVVVIMIGTNNIGHGSSDPVKTADGVTAIVHMLLREIPKCKILLLGVFPRGLTPQDRMRQDVAKATELFSELGQNDRVEFLDIGRHFLRSDGEMRTFLMPDLLHPNAAGYEIWARAMEPTLARMLGDDRVEPPKAGR